MTTTKVFKNGNSQALRIPVEMKTSFSDYYIRKVGETYIAYPTTDPWAPTKQAIDDFTEDYMDDREQPEWNSIPKREEL